MQSRREKWDGEENTKNLLYWWGDIFPATPFSPRAKLDASVGTFIQALSLALHIEPMSRAGQSLVPASTGVWPSPLDEDPLL